MKATARVVLEPLKGGFTATTFRVTGYDAQGRRLLPTVLKIGSGENIRREISACRNYVQKFILNNGTSILGTASLGNWAGICYNFVGISGPDSRLVWLRHHYVKRPVDELPPLFDRIFTDVLKPWYGQPSWQRLKLWSDHTPTRNSFPIFPRSPRKNSESPRMKRAFFVLLWISSFPIPTMC